MPVEQAKNRHFGLTRRSQGINLDTLKILTNAFGIIVSVGLLIPWAVIRTLKYRIDHLEVLQEGLLVEFQDSKTGSVTALGAETLDFFDLDLSL